MNNTMPQQENIEAIVANIIDEHLSQFNGDLSLRQFAKNIGISPGLLSLLKRGKIKISPKALIAILNAVNFSEERKIEVFRSYYYYELQATIRRIKNPGGESWSD